MCRNNEKYKRQVKGKLGHVVQIRVFLPSDVNLMLNLSKDLTHQDGKLRQKEEDGKTFVCDKRDRAFCRDFHLIFLDFHTKTCLKEGGRVWRNTMRSQAVLLRKFTNNGHDRF